MIDILKALKEGRVPTPGEPGEAAGAANPANVATESAPAPAPAPGNLAKFASVRIEDIPVAPVTQPLVMPTPPFTAEHTKPQPTLSELMPKPGPSSSAPAAEPPSSRLSAARPAPVMASASGAGNSSRMTANDPRAKDAMELCNFAIAALKVKKRRVDYFI